MTFFLDGDSTVSIYDGRHHADQARGCNSFHGAIPFFLQV